MFVRANPSRLCQGCRLDLQNLFEWGFSGRPSPSNGRRLCSRRLPGPSSSTRTFASKSRRLAQLTQTPKSPIRIREGDLTNDELILVSQLAAVEQIEKELGQQRIEPIEDDDDVINLIERYKSAYTAADVNTGVLGNPKQTLDNLRIAGANSNDIAREARQAYGDTLPKEVLNDEELTSYRRLYGEPAKVREGEDHIRATPNSQGPRTFENKLLYPSGEEIDHSHSNSESVRWSSNGLSDAAKGRDITDSISKLDGSVVYEDEYDDVEEDNEGDDEVRAETERGHPLTRLGKFRTSPRTLLLSQDGFSRPVENIISNYSNKHLKEMCERTFGGPGLPDSPLTPRSARSRQKVPIPLSVTQNTMGEMEANAFLTAIMPPTYASVVSVLSETRKRLGATWLNRLLAREGGPRVLDAGAGGAGIMAWKDIVQAHLESSNRKDQQSQPLMKSVVLTGSDGLRHRAAELLENTTFVPRLPDYVHSRDMPTLQDNRPSQNRKQFDVIIAPHALFPLAEDWMRKQYVQNLWAMLSDEGGVLILLEKGVSRGFEAIAGAREMLLDRYIGIPEGRTTHYSRNASFELDEDGIRKRDSGMIIAPCTNHEKCPMYTVPGISRGRKDICSFQQRYLRPSFLQRVLGAKDRNHDDVDFSYLAVMKGDDLRNRDVTTWSQLLDPLSAPIHEQPANLAKRQNTLVETSRGGFEDVVGDDGELSGNFDSAEAKSDQLPTLAQMPRIVLPPLKRRGHVTMDLCTPAGKIERWTVPRSFSKQAYRDARKSRWGDLWALGAKTYALRNLKLGIPQKDLVGKNSEIVIGKGRGRKERLKVKAMQLLEQREDDRMNELMEQRDMIASLQEDFDNSVGATESRGSDVVPNQATNKPMNNRERKAAKRALRDSRNGQNETTTMASNADLTFRPRRQVTATQELMMNDLAVEHNMSEWAAELDAVSGSRGKGKGGRRTTTPTPRKMNVQSE